MRVGKIELRTMILKHVETEAPEFTLAQYGAGCINMGRRDQWCSGFCQMAFLLRARLRCKLNSDGLQMFLWCERLAFGVVQKREAASVTNNH